MWFRNVNWVELYKKDIKSPFTPVGADNFDPNYCNKADEFDLRTYDYYLNKINTEKYFQDFYYNYYDYKDEREIEIEVDGILCKFANPHDEKYTEKDRNKGPPHLTSVLSTNLISNNLKANISENTSTLSMGQKIKDSAVNPNVSRDITSVSPVSHRKIIY